MNCINTWEEFAVVIAEVGPIVPVWTAARLHHVSDQALRDRISRGTLKTWSVDGAIYVSLLASRRKAPLATGQVVNPAYAG